jgi:hypothetical protein
MPRPNLDLMCDRCGEIAEIEPSADIHGERIKPWNSGRKCKVVCLDNHHALCYTDTSS